MQSLSSRRFRTLSLLILGLSGLAAVVPAQAQTSVYILTGGNSQSDLLVADSLRAAGFNVTLGVQTPSWNATQARLNEYDALVMLNNTNWRGKMGETGAASIRDFVRGGGGVITGEWLTYNAQWNSALAEFLPTTYAGFTGAESLETNFQLRDRDDVLSNGLSDRFNLRKGNAEGTESKLNAKAGAKVFYSSSATGAAGLAGWEFGSGKVLTFSNILTGSSDNNPNLNRLISNGVSWARRRTNDGGSGGGSGVKVTPEGSSIAMFACGVLPMGLVWARSRKRSRS